MMKAILGDLLVGATAQENLTFIKATKHESHRLEGRLTDLFDAVVLEKSWGWRLIRFVTAR